MNAAALNTVYNHYLTTYAPKGINSQYDTHKKSELRGVYNSIVKMNKEAPLAILDTSRDTQQFAVGLKESARSLHNSIASLVTGDVESLLYKKAAYSTDENVAAAKFIGESDAISEEGSSFTLEVKHLATSQTNKGRYLDADEKVSLPPGAYSFDIGINNLNYEFQFKINEGDTNKTLEERLSRLVNEAEIGLVAEVDENDEGGVALSLSSKATGRINDSDNIFRVSDDKTSRMNGTVGYLGIGETTTPASNAEFIINGEEKSAYSNNFSVGKIYEINLNGLSGDEPVIIGIKHDHEYLRDNLRKLIGGYNDFLKNTTPYLEKQPYSNRVLNELSGITGEYSEELNNIGILKNQDGELTFNEGKLIEALDGEDAGEKFEAIKDFSKALIRKTDNISLNPMNYAHKTIVAYKNPGHGYASPYVTSAYSGMMFNSYC